MSDQPPLKISAADVPPNTRRGGVLRTLLGPSTVGATSGFMGLATLQPGEYISEHYHPYSEEFLYVTDGDLAIRIDDNEVQLTAGDGVLIQKNSRHRLENRSRTAVSMVFQLAPLAPRPELGHVDTEPLPGEAQLVTAPSSTP